MFRPIFGTCWGLSQSTNERHWLEKESDAEVNLSQMGASPESSETPNIVPQGGAPVRNR